MKNYLLSKPLIFLFLIFSSILGIGVVVGVIFRDWLMFYIFAMFIIPTYLWFLLLEIKWFKNIVDKLRWGKLNPRLQMFVIFLAIVLGFLFFRWQDAHKETDAQCAKDPQCMPTEDGYYGAWWQ